MNSSNEITAAYSYYDIKENTRYLVYLTKTKNSSNGECRLGITNGVSVWSASLNEALVAKQQQTMSSVMVASLAEFMTSLSGALEADKYELNRVSDAARGGDELIELKTSCSGGTSLTVIADEAVSNKTLEIKSLLFGLFDKLKKLDKPMSDSSKVSRDETSGVSSSTSAGDALKKFNVAPSSQIKSRKAGMSIVNPLSKRKKLPQGVKFDDNGEYDESDPDSSSSGSKSSFKK